MQAQRAQEGVQNRQRAMMEARAGAGAGAGAGAMLGASMGVRAGAAVGAGVGAGEPPVAAMREKMANPRMLQDIWIYSIAKREWRQPTPGVVQPVARWMHTSVAFQDRMWIFGGCTTNMMLLNDVWMYDIKINTWSQIPPALDMPPPLPREGHTMIEDGTVFGGISYGYKPFNDVWLFDFKAGLWHRPRPRGPLPPARWLHTANMVNETMVIFGGCGERFVAMNDVWLYSKGFWAEVRPQGWPPQSRWLHTSLLLRSTFGDLLKIYGGAANNAPLEDMWTFNMTDGTWTESFDPLQVPMAREGHSMVLLEPPEVRNAERRRRRLLSDDGAATSEIEVGEGGGGGGEEGAGGLRGAAVPGFTPWRRHLLTSNLNHDMPSMQAALDRDSTVWVNGPNDVKKPEPVVQERFPEWFCLFGGVGERGLVASSQGGEGIFARRRR